MTNDEARLMVASAWHAAHPGAVVGLLAMRDVANPPSHPGLDAIATELERDLRARLGALDRADLRAVGTLPARLRNDQRYLRIMDPPNAIHGIGREEDGR